MFVCPADEGARRLGPDRGLSYALVPRWAGQKLGDAALPGSTVILYETGEDGRPVYSRHRQGVNVGYADGQVKWWPRKQAEGMIREALGE